MGRLWLGDGLMEAWRAHYMIGYQVEFAWDRDSLTNVDPVCGPSGGISALEIGATVGKMGWVSGFCRSCTCGGDARVAGKADAVWMTDVCDAVVRDGEDWSGSWMVMFAKVGIMHWHVVHAEA